MQNVDCIIAIGCSHLFGCEHKSSNNDTIPSTSTFVDLLGTKMNLPVYNFSQNGASNQSILRRLLIAIEFVKEKKLKPLFILQWTNYERYETLVPSAVYASADWPWLRTNTEIKRKSNDKILKKWAEDFYKLYETKTLLFESLRSIQHANSLLEIEKYVALNCLAEGWDLDNHNLKSHPGFVSSKTIDGKSIYSETLRTWYTNNHYEIDKDLLEKHKVEAYTNNDAPYFKDDIVLALLWNQIQKYKWWFYERDWKYGLKDYCIENNLDIGPGGHPLESAHEIVYRYLDSGNKFLSTLTHQ